MTPTAHPSDALPTLSEADAWAILGEAVTALRPLPGATRARVYEVTLGDGGVRIVKLLPKDTGRAAREAWVRGRMAGVGAVPMVPEVLHRATPLSGACDVVSMRPLPGQSLEGALHDADEARARRLWSAFGEGLAAFHAVPIAGFGLLDSAGRGPFPAWRMALEHHAAAALDVLRLTPLSPLADPIARRIEALAPSLDDVRAARLTHGDAHPRNVRAAGDRLVAWFDLEYAMGADPLYELTFVAEAFCGPCAPEGLPTARLAGRYEAFAEGYTLRGEALDDAAERQALYRLLHALRAAEELHVRGPRLSPEARDALTAALRTRLASHLPG